MAAAAYYMQQDSSGSDHRSKGSVCILGHEQQTMSTNRPVPHSSTNQGRPDKEVAETVAAAVGLARVAAQVERVMREVLVVLVVARWVAAG